MRGGSCAPASGQNPARPSPKLPGSRPHPGRTRADYPGEVGGPPRGVRAESTRCSRCGRPVSPRRNGSRGSPAGGFLSRWPPDLTPPIEDAHSADMSSGRKVCPWGCSDGKGEVDVVGAERARVPGLSSSSALKRCAECQGVSIAGMAMATSSRSREPRMAETRTALGRFEGEVWVPAAIHLPPLILQPKIGQAAARRRRSS
jgi:hypothetical protein